jgi:outer membrane protein assembly factor BamB
LVEEFIMAIATDSIRCPLAVVLVLSFFALAADWPQFRGPDRTDVSQETGLLKQWPKDGPKLLWTFENAGIGFSGPAIVGDRLYTMGARGADEFVFALDAKTGKELWSLKVGPLYTNGWGDGPRATPTVDGDVLYALGANGDLVCAESATGKKRWQVHYVNDLGGRVPDWGFCESVLIDGNHVICTPGGDKGTLAALDKKTGKTVWRSADLKDGAAYSSIIAVEVGGLRQYVQMTDGGVVGVAAKDGRLLWSSELAQNGTAIVPTPIFHDNHVYVASGYGAGGGLLKLTTAQDKTSAEKVWANKLMVNHHGGVLRVGEHVYGYSDNRGWVCQEFRTGKAAWAEKGKLGKGSLTCADGRLYLYDEDNGVCALIAASPMGWSEHGRFKIPRETKLDRKSGGIWTHPVVANGRLYLRDQDLLFCFEVQAR